MSRKSKFPTRQYAYQNVGAGQAVKAAALPSAISQGQLFEFVLGRHERPRAISATDLVSRARDSMASLVLGKGALPLTLRDLLKVLDGVTGAGALPEMLSFAVADGGLIPFNAATAGIDRDLRMVVTRASGAGKVPDLVVSTSSHFDSPDTFLQVVGWDSENRALQFYERRSGSWVWAGSGWDALEPDARGHGPFDSHVNGALNMKELKFPWVNWNSEAALIPDESFAPEDPFPKEPLWQNKSGAERLESEIVRPGIERWTVARFARRTIGGRVTRLPEFLRQLLTTTTINLRTSSAAASSVETGTDVGIPLSFFVNDDALQALGLPPGADPVPTVPSKVYRETLKRFDVALTDGTARFPGDTNFAFIFPEPAFEDVLVVQKLREIGLVPDRLAAALLMIDFCNPVFSGRRAALMAYVPESASMAPADFPDAFVRAVSVSAAAKDPGSAEAEFLAHWAIPEVAWKATYAARLKAFFDAVVPRLATTAGFDPIYRLADSRRREFRQRPLAEFELTTPTTNIPVASPFLEFTVAGAVQSKQR